MAAERDRDFRLNVADFGPCQESTVPVTIRNHRSRSIVGVGRGYRNTMLQMRRLAIRCIAPILRSMPADEARVLSVPPGIIGVGS